MNYMDFLGIIMLFAALNMLALHNDQEVGEEKHYVIKGIGCVLASLGVINLVSVLITTLQAKTTAQVNFNFSVFILFALALYCFDFRSSKSTVWKKILKILYVSTLIFCFAGICLNNEAELFLVLEMILVGILYNRIENSKSSFTLVQETFMKQHAKSNWKSLF